MLSKKRVASFQRRTLITMSAKILAMQEQWENRDQELLNQMDKLQLSVNKVIKKLESKMAKIDDERTSREERLKEEVETLREKLKKVHVTK